ncbi:MAG: amidohydrolase [Actinomycetota bacterium]|nr:MAG: amidohydrolase [Actinomycetota bacterium]
MWCTVADPARRRGATEDVVERHRPALAAFLAGHGDELVGFRRRLHAHPELAGGETETTEAVCERLQLAGLRPEPLAVGTGLTCDVGASNGPVVMLRADLDALGMPDGKDVSYRSRVPGRAHACGHDVHTAIVLGAGLVLAQLLPDTGGRVRLVFEPGEEAVPGGAVDVIAEGRLDGVSAAFGLHCEPKLDVGVIGVRPGPLTAAADLIELTLTGPGGHTARPELTVDLVAVAAELVLQVPSLVATRSGGDVLIVFGAVRGGDAANVIPSQVTIRGTLRTHDRAVWGRAEQLLRDAVATVADPLGAGWELAYRTGVPPVVNDEAATQLVAEVGRAVLGHDGVVEAPRSRGGDSFAWYLDHVPGSYVRLGVHDPASGRSRGDLHASTFDVDERAIGYGVQVLALTALAALTGP